MKLYPYKVLKTGKFTKYELYITDESSIMVCYYFKGILKRRDNFTKNADIKKSKLPQEVKLCASWANFEKNEGVIGNGTKRISRTL